MPNTVLITLDRSPLAERALDYLPRLFKPETHIRLLTVLNEQHTAELSTLASTMKRMGYFSTDLPPIPSDAYPHQASAAHNYLLDLAENLETQGYLVTVEVLESRSVTDAIVAAANTGTYDAVLMVTRGRSGLRKLALGSVTDTVLKKANCPVIVLPGHGEIDARSA